MFSKKDYEEPGTCGGTANFLLSMEMEGEQPGMEEEEGDASMAVETGDALIAVETDFF